MFLFCITNCPRLCSLKPQYLLPCTFWGSGPRPSAGPFWGLRGCKEALSQDAAPRALGLLAELGLLELKSEGRRLHPRTGCPPLHVVLSLLPGQQLVSPAALGLSSSPLRSSHQDTCLLGTQCPLVKGLLHLHPSLLSGSVPQSGNDSPSCSKILSTLRGRRYSRIWAVGAHLEMLPRAYVQGG